LIDFNDNNVIVLNTPGHSKGSVCFWFKKEKALFSGDTLFSVDIGRVDLPGGSMKEMTESLKLLKTLPDDLTVYPGHEEITTLGKEKKTNMYYQGYNVQLFSYFYLNVGIICYYILGKRREKMIQVNDLKPGTSFAYENEIFSVLDYMHNKTAMRGMIIKVKVKNLRNGVIKEVTFTGGDKVEAVHLDKKSHQYLYADGDDLVFMDNETYEQINIPKERLQWEINFLVETKM
jgi:translation elongation factor P/translation initiation factor 5A